MAKKILSDETGKVIRAETPLELELLIMWREASEWKRQRIRRLFFAIKNGLQLDMKTVSKMTDDEKIAFVEALPKVYSKRFMKDAYDVFVTDPKTGKQRKLEAA